MIDGVYTIKLESGNLQRTIPIQIDNTPPEISKPMIKNKAGHVEITYLIEDPIVNNFSSGLNPDIFTGFIPAKRPPEITDVKIDIIDAQKASVTFIGEFPFTEDAPEFDEILNMLNDSDLAFSVQKITDRTQIVPEDKVKNREIKYSCPAPGPKIPKNITPYRPLRNPSFQSCFKKNIQLLAVLDNHKEGPDLSFVFGTWKSMPLKELIDFRESKEYENFFTWSERGKKTGFHEKNIKVTSSFSGQLAIKACGATVRPGDTPVLLDNMFAFDGATFMTGTKDDKTPYMNNLFSYLEDTKSKNVFEDIYFVVAVNLHKAYVMAKKGKANIPLKFSNQDGNFMNVFLNLSSDGVWDVTCQPKTKQ